MARYQRWDPLIRLGLGARVICSRGEGDDRHQLGYVFYMLVEVPGTESLLGWMVASIRV